ncbi:MAG: Hint domain-containing protein, partial [Chthoniobacterales bacterium]|nr:Hint domain-containing protein [Chthoniobacterales bacterium]
AVFPGTSLYTYGYTTRDQLQDLTYAAANVVSYTYDLNGNVAGRTPGTNAASGYLYDAMNRLTKITDTFGSPPVNKVYNYGYDEVGNRNSIQRDGGVTDALVYNKNSEMTSFSLEGTATSLSYDPSGNRINTTAGMSYLPANNLNQYTTVGGQALTYGGNGNLSTYNTWTYSFDAQNRLTSADKTGTNSDFYYDGLNRQVARVLNGIATYSVWDGAERVAEYDASGNVLNRWIYAGGDLVRSPNPQQIYYYPDGLGSTSRIADASGIVLEKYTYDVGGSPAFYAPGGTTDLGQSAYGVDMLFTGQKWYSQLGIYDLRHRAYLPSIGRFLQPDPIGFGGDPANIYRYCGNNPVNSRDPSGLGVNEKTPDAVPTVIKRIIVTDLSSSGDPLRYGEGSALVSTGGGGWESLSIDNFGGGGSGGGGGGFSIRTGLRPMPLLASPTISLAPPPLAYRPFGQSSLLQGMSPMQAIFVAIVLGAAGESGEFAAEEATAVEAESSAINCFPKGTEIATANGPVKIEDIKPGDLVEAYDFKTAKVVDRKVEKLNRSVTYHWATVRIGRTTMRATRSHPFWVESEKRWIKAADLKKGMRLRFASGRTASIQSVLVADLKESERTYNLVVARDHDYFAGKDAVLVHNGPAFVAPNGSGSAVSIPPGANGPVPVINNSGIITGFSYQGGSGGLNGQVNTVRIMDPTDINPNGYAVYENGVGPDAQAVNPLSGRTVGPEDAHYSLTPCD